MKTEENNYSFSVGPFCGIWEKEIGLFLEIF